MQIDANDVVLYMQISHATTLWLLFSEDRRTLECFFVDARVYLFMFGCMSGDTSTRLQMQSILRLL